ncbi:MAG: right-handed parallel beta-helix repeat-containing protein [Armatimonadetes bacterium]|nr:right-handed parallel beta-helix repeat-containing protein [Armatimonadota bacterium]
MSRCTLTPAAILLAALTCAIAACQPAVNQQAIDDVKSGRLTTAKASWWGFDEVDSTAALQAAINSGAQKLIIENMGKPWIVTPIQLASNQEIFFEKGAEILAKKGEYKGRNDALMTAANKENIVLNGYGATLRMHRSDYDGPEYEKAEWRHCLSIRSCTNVKVLGLTLAESGGDGIYLGVATRGRTNQDIVIKDVLCDRNYRQGISVISAENLLIENTTLRDTAGTPPQAGIDFEPNESSEKIANVVMRNCLSQGNKGGGFVAYLPSLTAESAPVTMRFENCRSVDDAGPGCAMYTGNTEAAAVLGNVVFTNCIFERSGGGGIYVGGKPVGGMGLSYVDCSIIDPAPNSVTAAPIILAARDGSNRPVGEIEFRNILIRDAVDRAPMTYVDNSGEAGLEAITGNLIIERDGQREDVLIDEAAVKKWMPYTLLKRYAKFDMGDRSLVPVYPDAAAACDLSPIRNRGTATYILFAKEGDDVSFAVKHGQVGKYGGSTMPVTVTSPSGAVVADVKIPFQGEGKVEFAAPETGAYTVKLDAGANYVAMGASTNRMCIIGAGSPIRFLSTVTKLYFYVPEGVTEFGVKLFGEGSGEGVKATLYNPSGEMVGEQDNITRAHQFDVTLPAVSKGEVWCLAMAKPSGVHMEDHYVDLLGIPSVMSTSPEALLKPED